MSIVVIVYGIIFFIIIVLFFVGVLCYIYKWKEGVVKLNYIEEEFSDLMLYYGK